MASVNSTSNYKGRMATLTVTVQSQSIENNKTILAWSLEVKGGVDNYYDAYSVKAVVAGETVYGPISKVWDTRVFPAARGTVSGTKEIEHNADGSHNDITFTIGGAFFYNTPADNSNTLSIPTIPRASNVSCNNVTLGDNVTISCPRASSGFTNTLYIKDGNTTIETFSGSWDSKSWTPTLANYGNRIVLSKQFTIQCDTYSGGTYIGTKYCYPTLYFPSGYEPTCTVSVSPNNANCPPAWGNRYVQYKSMVNVSVSFSGQFGATLSSRSSSVPNAGSSSNASWVSNTLSTYGSLNVTASVTDNRGRSDTDSQPITVYQYFSPRINRSLAERNGNTLTVTYSYEIASVDGANAHRFKVDYKKKNQTWSQASNLVDDTSNLTRTNATASTSTLDSTSSYDIRFTITDSTGSIETFASVGTVFDLMNFHSSGLAMALGKMSEAGANEKLFEVDLPTKIYNGYISRADAGSWISDRDRATARNTNNGNTGGYSPVVSQKTKDGNWTIGSYQTNELIFNYTQDSNYPNSNNAVQWRLGTDGFFNGSVGKVSIANRNTSDTWIPVIRNGYLDYTTRYMPNTQTHSQYNTDQDRLVTLNFMSFWNGAFNASGNSNLTYCSGGTIANQGQLPILGSNYIRFPNIRYQICWMYPVQKKVLANNRADHTFDFPVAFSSNPTVITSAGSDSTVTNVGYVFVGLCSWSTTQVTFRLFNKDTSGERWPWLSYIAIGPY